MRARRALAREEGVALTTALMIIVLISAFAAVMAHGALNANEASSRDRDSKRALAAAQAGVNTALARLNRVVPRDWQCLADAPTEVQSQATEYVRLTLRVQVDPGYCGPSSIERAGTRERFHWYLTPAVSSLGSGCANPLGVAANVSRATLLASGLSVLERCITVVGSANAVNRRVQVPVYSTLRLFSGVTAAERLEVRGRTPDPDQPGDSGERPTLGATVVHTNGEVRMERASFAGQVERQRRAPEPVMQDVDGAWTSSVRDKPFPLAPVDPEPAEQANDNASIACAGPLTDPLCTTQPAYVSTPGRRSLTVRPGYTVTLPGGTYHLCDLQVSGGSLVVAATAQVFVDHPDREAEGAPGDGCDDTTDGQVRITGGVVNPAGALAATGVAGNLRVYVRGADGAQDVLVQGSSTTIVNALLYAASSHVRVEKASAAGAGPVVTGAISARQVAVSGHLTTVAGMPDLGVTLEAAQLPAFYVPGDWVECRSKGAWMTSGRPHSGCRGS